MPIKNIVTGNNITNQRPETALVTARPTVFEGPHIGDGVTWIEGGQDRMKIYFVWKPH